MLEARRRDRAMARPGSTAGSSRPALSPRTCASGRSASSARSTCRWAGQPACVAQRPSPTCPAPSVERHDVRNVRAAHRHRRRKALAV